MGKIVFVTLLLIHFLLISKKAVYCRDHRKLIPHLSPFLEPPPITRSIKAYPLLHKHPPPVKHAHHAHVHAPPIENHFGVDSMVPKLANWFWPVKKERDKIPSESVLQTRSHDFAIDDKKCNPCNSVPWIPILGVHHHVAKQLEPAPVHQHTAYSAHLEPAPVHQPTAYSAHLEPAPVNQPTAYSAHLEQAPAHQPTAYLTQLEPAPVHQPTAYSVQQEPAPVHQPTAYSADSYYSSFNEMSSNLKSINAVPSPYPLYFGNPVYNHDLTHNHLQDSPAPGWNAASFSSSGVDNVQEPSLHNPQIGPPSHFVQNTSFDNWPYEPKAMPLSHYLWSVDYPMQVYQTPLLDVPSFQLPEPGANLPLHVQNQVFQSTVAPSHDALSHHFTSSSADGTNDQYNAFGHNSIDDNKYSPSESKFSSIAAESNHINDSYPKSSYFTENVTDTLIEYLTPPSVSSSDWLFETETETPKKKKQIQIVIPYTVNKNHKANDSEDWATERSLSQKLKEIWGSFIETTTPLPLVSYLKGNSSVTISKITVPNKRQEVSDMLRLQKAIDTWTVEGYSNHKHKPEDYYFQKVSTSTLSPSKEIPPNYLASTVSYIRMEPVRSVRGKYYQNPIMEEKMHKNYQGNTLSKNNSSKPWEKLPVSVSPLTKEKVYIVTPLPLTSYNFSADGLIQNWP